MLNIAHGWTLKSVAKPTWANVWDPSVARNSIELPGPAVTPLSARVPSTSIAPPATVAAPPADQGVETQPAGRTVPSNGSSRVRASSTAPSAPVARTTVLLGVPAEKSAAVSSDLVTVAALAVAALSGPTAAATSAAVTILRVLELLSMATLPCWSCVV